MENTNSNFILLYPHKIIKKNNLIITLKNKFKINKKKKVLIFMFILIFTFLIIGVINVLKKLDFSSIGNIFHFSLKYNEFNEYINKQYIKFQNDFCKINEKNVNNEFENKLKITNVKFNGKNFDMYIYKGEDLVSYSIKTSNNYEGSVSINILKALEYYKNKNNFENKDIYILDVGSNVGWYTYFLGKYGFKIMSFEANKINSYILYKNYCLNKDVKTTIINKGLDLEEKKCYLKIVEKNQGDGITYCGNLGKLNKVFNGEIFDNIELTTLSKYIKFLTKNNLALIKIDVEGAEGNVIMGGKKLISEYHIPFIFMEYSKKYLEAHGTNVLELLQFFEKNGYKISQENFFSKKYLSTLELINKNEIINLFITHEKIL